MKIGHCVEGAGIPCCDECGIELEVCGELNIVEGSNGAPGKGVFPSDCGSSGIERDEEGPGIGCLPSASDDEL